MDASRSSGAATMSLLPRHRQPSRFSVHPPGTSPRFVVWGPGPKPSLGTDVGAGGDCPMNIRKILALGSLSLVAACGSSAGGPTPGERTAALGQGEEVADDDGVEIRHVLLITVDGVHETDVAHFIAEHPESTFAELAYTGVQ